MTLNKPTLALRQIAAFKDNRRVLDATFHNGVNVVRGHNSSGKTTALDFIAYALGAENIPWKQEALLCDEAMAEVSLNGSPVTLRRRVNTNPLNPMHIFWGAMDKALAAPITEWEVYPFKRSTSKISFTQAILLGLELPDAQGDGASNLTMHQFLRVLYADQPSLHSPIFRSDTFDSALTRETVGNYLCGIYDDALYSAQLERRTREKEVAQLDAELKSIFIVLAKSQRDTSFEFIGSQIQTLEQERDQAVKELTRLKTERSLEKGKRSTQPDAELRTALDAAKVAVSRAQESLLKKELEVADSSRFIREVRSRLVSLNESNAAREYLGSLVFSFCPCCLSPVPLPEDNGKNCALCKNPLIGAAGDVQMLRMRNELRIQLLESEQLVSVRAQEIQDIQNALPGLKQSLRALEKKYQASTQVWSSELENAVEAQARRIGELDQEIKGLYENQRLAEVIRQLQNRRNAVSVEITRLNTIIESRIYTQEQNKKAVALEVASTLGRLLRLDLHRQEEFKKAENIQFSFTDNVVSVDGATQFSESSTVVLRHLFHVALLSASCKIPAMRFPRLLILDGIEDGGMELERSHRLQEIIATECNTFKCEYQLIFATSQIAPNLEKPEFVVSRAFSEERRSLDILSPQAAKASEAPKPPLAT